VDGFGVFSMGPEATDPIILSDVASPLLLPRRSERVHQEYWLTHAGYSPFRFRMPSGLPPGEVQVFLSAAASIEVELDGEVETGCMVHLYQLADNPPLAVGSPLRSSSASRHVTMSDIVPGRYAVTLETAPGEGGSDALAMAYVTLATGQATAVTLTAGTASSGRTLGRITFESSALDGDFGRYRAKIVPLSPRADRHARNDARTARIGDGVAGRWGPIALRAGEYALQLGSTSQVFRFRIGAGDDLQVVVPLLPVREFYLQVVDGQTGLGVPVRALMWSTPMNLDGSLDGDSRLVVRTAQSPESPIRIEAPAAQVLIRAFTEGYGEIWQIVDLSDARDPVVAIDRPTCLTVRAGALDQKITLDWLTRVRLSSGGHDLSVDSSEVVTCDGATVGRIFLRAAGLVQVAFPPLDSYGELQPVQLSFDRNANQDVVLAELVQSASR
jgi:hypothetical protein